MAEHVSKVHDYATSRGSSRRLAWPPLGAPDADSDGRRSNFVCRSPKILLRRASNTCSSSSKQQVARISNVKRAGKWMSFQRLGFGQAPKTPRIDRGLVWPSIAAEIRIHGRANAISTAGCTALAVSTVSILEIFMKEDEQLMTDFTTMSQPTLRLNHGTHQRPAQCSNHGGGAGFGSPRAT